MATEKMRAFIIKFLFFGIILGIIYLAFTFVVPLIMPFLLAFLISFILQPVVRSIKRKTKTEGNAVAILILIAFYAVLITFLIIVGSQIIVYVSDLFVSLPTIYSNQIEPAIIQAELIIENFLLDISPAISDIDAIFDETLASSISSVVTNVSAQAITMITNAATSIPSFIISFLMLIIASFFFMCDYDKIMNFLIKLLPVKARDKVVVAKKRGIKVIIQFARAYAILLSITGIELFIAFLLLGIENALLLAILIAIVDILPILGTGTILIPWGIVMLILGNFPMGIAILITYAIITIVRQSLEPRIVGGQIGLYPLITLICMFTGAYLFGVLGLFGLPITAAIIVQLNKSGDLNWF